jgi:hypothetical protein
MMRSSRVTPVLTSTELVGVLSGLGGIVLAGGLQTVLAVLERRRNARVAGRLLYMHLWWARQTMEAVFNEGVWDSNADWDVFQAAWDGQRAALAHALTTKRFLVVAGAFTSLEQLAMTRANDLANPSGPIFSPIRSDYADVYRSYVEHAILILNRASFTWWERQRGFHESSERETKGRSPSATGDDRGLLLIGDGTPAQPPLPISPIA